MTAGPRGTAGCELRQVREEAAAAIPTFAAGPPGCHFLISYRCIHGISRPCKKMETPDI